MGGRRTGRVTRKDIAKAESLPALIEQLVKRAKEGNAEVKEASACALKSIAEQNHGENAETLVKAGAVKPLVQLVINGSSDAQYNACGALGIAALLAIPAVLHNMQGGVLSSFVAPAGGAVFAARTAAAGSSPPPSALAVGGTVRTRSTSPARTQLDARAFGSQSQILTPQTLTGSV